MRISLKLLGVYMGVFFTLLFAVSSFICWKAGINAFVAFLSASTWIPVMFLGLPLVCWWWRQQNGFYLTFLQATQFFFVAYLVYEVGYGLFNVILYDALDKTLFSRALILNLERIKSSLVQMNQPVVSVQAEIDEANRNISQGISVKQFLLGFGQAVVTDFIKALLLGIVLQKKLPPVNMPDNFAQTDEL